MSGGARENGLGKGYGVKRNKKVEERTVIERRERKIISYMRDRESEIGRAKLERRRG